MYTATSLTAADRPNPFKTWSLVLLQKDPNYTIYVYPQEGMIIGDINCSPFKRDDYTYTLTYSTTSIPDQCAMCDYDKEEGWQLVHDNSYLFYCIGCVLYN